MPHYHQVALNPESHFEWLEVIHVYTNTTRMIVKTSKPWSDRMSVNFNLGVRWFGYTTVYEWPPEHLQFQSGGANRLFFGRCTAVRSDGQTHRCRSSSTLSTLHFSCWVSRRTTPCTWMIYVAETGTGGTASSKEALLRNGARCLLDRSFQLWSQEGRAQGLREERIWSEGRDDAKRRDEGASGIRKIESETSDMKPWRTDFLFISPELGLIWNSALPRRYALYHTLLLGR